MASNVYYVFTQSTFTCDIVHALILSTQCYYFYTGRQPQQKQFNVCIESLQMRNTWAVYKHWITTPIAYIVSYRIRVQTNLFRWLLYLLPAKVINHSNWTWTIVHNIMTANIFYDRAEANIKGMIYNLKDSVWFFLA